MEPYYCYQLYRHLKKNVNKIKIAKMHNNITKTLTKMYIHTHTNKIKTVIAITDTKISLPPIRFLHKLH